VSIREISVYQSVKVPIMQQAAAIDPSKRVADIVQQKAGVVRVFIDPASGFSARALEAHLTIVNGATRDVYAAKVQVSKASTDADPSSTFQLSLPATEFDADTTYSLELVECAAGSGAMLSPRFPTTGETALQARKTGILKVTLIPVQTNSHMPDTSAAALTNYKNYLEAMYPIERADLTVGTSITTAYPIDWSTMVEQIRTQRQTDKVASDVYYFGMVKPTDTLKDYCRSGCTAGIGYVGSLNQPAAYAAVGLAYADETSASTMAHEVGHNHGRNHAPCAPGNNISGVDPNYPYAGAKLGTWGYDVRNQKFFDPTATYDIMGYCDPKWISDYTYKGLLERVAAINLPHLELAADGGTTYSVMIVDANGPRWSQPFSEPGEAFGEPEQAEVLDVEGRAIEEVTVYRTWHSDLESSILLVPPPLAGWNAIRVAGAPALPFSAPITVPAPVTH
jgi:hypothetical protein